MHVRDRRSVCMYKSHQKNETSQSRQLRLQDHMVNWCSHMLSSVCVYICLSLCLFIYLSVNLFVYLSTGSLSVYLSVSLFIYPDSLSVCQYIRLTIIFYSIIQKFIGFLSIDFKATVWGVREIKYLVNK